MAHSHSHEQHDINPHDLGHILPFAVYLRVFIALIVLTAITVGVTRFDFGAMNMVVAMGIASIKAGLVALYFMHLRYENPVTWLYVAFPIFLLLLLLAGIFVDNPYRWQPDVQIIEPDAQVIEQK